MTKKYTFFTITKEDIVEKFTMKISAQEEYGLRCLLRLAKAESGVATLPEVAAAEGLSVPYVAKLMAVLRHAGILDSVRGRSGGYKLARPARRDRPRVVAVDLGRAAV